MSQFTLNNNHQLIPNSNQYYIEKKYVSIHSEDRDILKYPNSSEFEIELPQDYLNIQSVRLSTWSFPCNYSVFSINTNNVYMTFKFSTLYNPGENSYGDPLTEAIFAGLYYNIDNDYLVEIEPGFYNPIQMATELTNKFNQIVSVYLASFFTSTDPLYIQYNYAAALFTEYTRFVIVYSEVGQKLSFGNNADQFTITNTSDILAEKKIFNQKCLPGRRSELPNYSDFGLPSFLGFNRVDIEANSASYYLNSNITDESGIIQSTDPIKLVPRLYYIKNLLPNDNGYWINTELPGATIYYLMASNKINFMGPAYIYMEIEGLNCIDETSPFNLSKFTTQTNQTNGIVNSAFAKIPVISTPISQWFDADMWPYKHFNPPSERIRKLQIKFRYHNNTLVNFGTFDYSFTLEFIILRPQNERKYTIVL